VCTGCCLYFLSGAGINGDSSGAGIGCFGPGDSCPPEGAELIPSSSDFTLFSIEDDTGIYACQNGIVVGQCVIIEGTTQLLVVHLKVTFESWWTLTYLQKCKHRLTPLSFPFI
jgi:hypothetical protein